MVAYADDVMLLVETDSRTKLEVAATDTLRKIIVWGRLCFAPQKSRSVTIRDKLQRPPTIWMVGTSIDAVASATVLGVCSDSGSSFNEHAKSISSRVTNYFGKMSLISASSWGTKYRCGKYTYIGIFVATTTYAAGYWWERAWFSLPC